MKSKFGHIINEGDIDFSIVGKYIKNFWYLPVAFMLLGGVLGYYKSKSEVTTYTVQAIFDTPESWEAVEQAPQVVLYQFAKQYAQTNPEYDMDVLWAVRPVDNQGTNQQSLVYVQRKSLTKEKGVELFTKFINELSKTDQVKQMNEKSKKELDQKKITLQQDQTSVKTLLKSYEKLMPSEKTTLTTEAFNKSVAINSEISKISTKQRAIGDLKWLTEPNFADINEAKSWQFFVIMFGFFGGLLGIVLALIPGILSNEKRN